MAHRTDRQALVRTRRGIEIRSAFSLQQPHANVRKIQRHFPQEGPAKRGRKGAAPLRRRSQGHRRRARQGCGGGKVRCTTANIVPHGLLRTRSGNRQGRPVVPRLSAGHAANRRQHQAVTYKLQRICQQKNQGTPKAEELPRSRVRRRSRQWRSQAQSPRKSLIHGHDFSFPSICATFTLLSFSGRSSWQCTALSSPSSTKRKSWTLRRNSRLSASKSSPLPPPPTSPPNLESPPPIFPS